MKRGVRGGWRRFVKRLLRMDPLVGMYFLNAGQIGRVLDRIETTGPPRYLVYFYCGDFANSIVLDLSGPAGPSEVFYTLKEARRCRDWRARYFQRPKMEVVPWSPPTPEAPKAEER